MAGIFNKLTSNGASAAGQIQYKTQQTEENVEISDESEDIDLPERPLDLDVSDPADPDEMAKAEVSKRSSYEQLGCQEETDSSDDEEL